MPTSILTSILVAGGARGAANLTGFERTLGFLNTALFSNLLLVGLLRGPKRPPGAAVDSVGQVQTVKQPVPPRQVIVGQARTGGALTFVHVSSDSKFWHMVITFAGHRCQEIGDIYFDDQLVALSGGGTATGKYLIALQPRTFSGVVPGSPFQATVTSTVDSVVQVVLDVDPGDDVDSAFTLIDVSPSAPADITQYSRSGNTFTFHSSAAGYFVDIAYNEPPLSHVRIKKSLGDEGAAQPFPDLVAESDGKWTNAHLQAGCAKIYVRLQANTDLFPSGVPNVSAVIKGASIYDNRSALTAYSNNVALWISNYFTSAQYGLAADFATEIDAADLTAAANVCEERVALAVATAGFTADPATDAIAIAAGSKLPQEGDGVRVASTATLPAPLAAATTYYIIRAAGLIKLATSFANALAGAAIDITTSGSGTHTLTYFDEPRYRANGVFLTSETPADILGRLLAAMAGKAATLGDKWHIYAGAYFAPTATLSEKDMRGALKTQVLVSAQENANGVKGVFTDPNSDWQPTDFPANASAAYLAEDNGERVWKDVDYSAFVTSVTQAQRLAKIELLKIRQGLTHSAPCKMTAFGLVPGRSVALNNAKYGWSAKPFDIQSFKFVVESDDQGAPRLGVDLMLRETAAAIYDWSTSEEQAVDFAPNTNLPDAGFVSPPGAPSVAEILYDTTGSAGIKSRVELTIGPSTDAYVVAYQVEYKPANSVFWKVLPPRRDLTVPIADIELDTYQFRVLAISSIGIRSAYSPITTKQFVGLTAPPSDVANFAVQSYSGQAKFTWKKFSANSDLDVTIGGRVFVRWSPRTDAPTWNDGTLINPDGFPGDTSIGFGPLTTGTYFAKAMDSSGNFSVNAASFVITEAVLVALTTIATITESPAFTGAKTNIAAVDGGIQLDGTTLIDSMAALIDSWGSIDSLGGVRATGSYGFASKLDLASVQPARLFANIDGNAFDVDDLIDSRTNNIDDWGLFDGVVVEDAEVQLMVRSTNDDPNGTPIWGPWHALGQVGDYNARGFDFRLDFATGNVTHNRRVLTLSVAAKH